MINKKVITIRELKNLIKDLPEVDAETFESLFYFISISYYKLNFSPLLELNTELSSLSP